MPASRPTRHSAARVLLLATDAQRSVLAELDRTGPNRLAYPPYGAQSSLLAAGTHLGFNGQLRERSTGRYHLGNGHRVYNPVLKCFQSPDRLSPFEEGGLNAYAYCKGDPINYTDPTGKVMQAIGWGAIVTLHGGSLAFTALGPTPANFLTAMAARAAVAGSILALGGVGLGVAGVTKVAAQVATAGTMMTAAAAGARAFNAIAGAVENGVKNTFLNNTSAIFGFPRSKKVVKTPAPSVPPVDPVGIDEVIVERRHSEPSLRPSDKPHLYLKREPLKSIATNAKNVRSS